MLKVTFPTIGEYDYDSSEKNPHDLIYHGNDEKIHQEEFWAPYDPFGPYDPFEPYESCDSFNKWREECLKNSMEDHMLCHAKDHPLLDSIKDPMLPNMKDPLSSPLTGECLLDTSKNPMEERFHVMYHQAPVVSPSWFLYGLRIFACLVLAIALYCFCNGYQEVKFLEIVNKCLEGHHNPMCEGFMEPESTMNDYKPITVQEDMYADRLEWIPKTMTPSQEYVTLVSILERHPCQSLRCLDKLTAQIYGGDQVSGTKAAGQTGQTPAGTNLSVKDWREKPEYRDRMDDVLKQMGKLPDTTVELKAEVIKKNKEYLIKEGSVANAGATKQDFTRRNKRDVVKRMRSQNVQAPRQFQEQDFEQHVQSLVPEDLDNGNDRGIFITTLRQSQIKELPDKADMIINDQDNNIQTDVSDIVLTSSNHTGIVLNSSTLEDGSPGSEDHQPSECLSVLVSDRFDCHPEWGASESACLDRGCCWRPVQMKNSTSNPQHGFPHHAPDQHKSTLRAPSPRISPPFCYYPPSYATYHAIHHQDTPTGQEALLQLLRPSGHTGDQPELRLQVVYETETRLKIQVTSSEGPPPPTPVLPLTGGSAPPLNVVHGPQQREQQYRVSLTQHNAAITVTRANTNTTLFSSRGAAPLVYARQFIQVSSVLASSHVYGLGQHLDGLMLDVDWTRYVLWNADQPPEPGSNLYGSHPFYMVMESNGDCHGVFLLNTNAMSVVIQPAPALTFTTTGGGLTLYVLTGPSPTEVIRQYTELVGRPTMPPYWALGYHQCRFGYGSLEETKKVWQRTRDAGIPFDVQWNDLDYMADRNDFTYDEQKFAGLPQFVEQLHQLGMHYVPIIDPGISGSEPSGSYPPYDEGADMGIFVRNSTGQFFVGKVWNRKSTVWPDFSHPRALYYWARQLVRFHGLVPYDGAWIDMNEPSNFYDGTVLGCNISDPLNAPPFLPPGLVGGSLYHKTLCGDARQYTGRHYTQHNLYANMEAVATNVGLKVTRGERPLVISRASYPGLGVWAGHWTGDVTSDWHNLRASVPDILNFNLFGVPLVGADICGFNGNTTAALCLRWIQLGAFYPFSRNHNTDDAIDQDPVALGPDVVLASRNALLERYRLLPYLYTLFYRAQVLGDTVARPLFMQFPSDPATFSISSQFLWGDGLMIVPALQENVETVEAYLPCGSVWYDWYSGTRLDADEARRADDVIDSVAKDNDSLVLDQAGDLTIIEADGLGRETVGVGQKIDDEEDIATSLDEYSDASYLDNDVMTMNGDDVRRSDDSNKGNDESEDSSGEDTDSGIKQNNDLDDNLSSESINNRHGDKTSETVVFPSITDTDITEDQPIYLHNFDAPNQGPRLLPRSPITSNKRRRSATIAGRQSQPGCYYTELPAALDRVPLLVRGGAVLPTQAPNITTTQSRENPYSAVVALDQSGEAWGQLYVDDGVSIDPVGSGLYTLLDFRAGERKLVISCDHSGYKGDMMLDGVRVLGVLGVVESVTVNGEPRSFQHDAQTQVLEVKDLKWTLPLYFVMKW